ncbi:hypothetical protein evm_001316 [Chilo suppressalis]|nr:hypothetical protein evm_001316 [Chilo suppressalis]
MSTPAKVTKVTLNRPSFRSENKHVNKEKMERFKKLISKNKDTLNEYLNKKLKTHAKKTVSPRKKTHMPLKHEPTLRADTLMSVNDKETTRFKSGTEEPVMVVSTITPGEGSLNEDFGARLRARDEKSNKEPVVPRADDLDMSPAKGRKVHVMRLKGRLCQRNVMLPEGPKYDSQGRMYLGAYVNKYDRDYSNTKRPRLLLPRCCNCCKKSVLGCE